LNLQEAYSILGLPTSASQEEAKKRYRELTRKYHPDINKEPGAEEKFKKINEAYGCVQSGKGTDKEPPIMRNPFDEFGIRNPFGRQQYRNYVPLININITITFKESVLGCKKDISFKRYTQCDNCGGQGEQHINNGCDKCKGSGMITQRRGGMIFSQTCDKCGGVRKMQPCQRCNASGNIEVESSVQVNIPGGVESGDVLRLNGMGNYMGSIMGFAQYTDVHLHIEVEPAPGLSIIGRDVVSHIDISLLEALSGCNKKVNTINGEIDISIPPKSKNKDEVIIPKLGVEGIGSQRVILNVQYPDNIQALLNVLA